MSVEEPTAALEKRHSLPTQPGSPAQNLSQQDSRSSLMSTFSLDNTSLDSKAGCTLERRGNTRRKKMSVTRRMIKRLMSEDNEDVEEEGQPRASVVSSKSSTPRTSQAGRPPTKSLESHSSMWWDDPLPTTRGAAAARPSADSDQNHYASAMVDLDSSLTARFSINVACVNGIPAFSVVKGYAITIGLFDGKTMICPEQTSELIGLSATPTWNEVIKFDVLVKDLPPTVRVCATLAGVIEANESDEQVSRPLFYVNVKLFEPSPHVKSVPKRFGLWPVTLETKDILQPMATTGENPSSAFPGLIAQFPAIECPYQAVDAGPKRFSVTTKGGRDGKVFTCMLRRQSSKEKLGLAIAGGGNGGIHIKTVYQGGVADKRSVLRKYDQILAVDGESVSDLSHEAVVDKLKATGKELTITVRRPRKTGSTFSMIVDKNLRVGGRPRTGSVESRVSATSTKSEKEMKNVSPEFLAWLKKIGLEQYLKLFTVSGFDELDLMASLTPDDLGFIGIPKPGHRKRLLLAVRKLNRERLGIPDHDSAFSTVAEDDENLYDSDSASERADGRRSTATVGTSSEARGPRPTITYTECGVQTEPTHRQEHINRLVEATAESQKVLEATMAQVLTLSQQLAAQQGDLARNLSQMEDRISLRCIENLAGRLTEMFKTHTAQVVSQIKVERPSRSSSPVPVVPRDKVGAGTKLSEHHRQKLAALRSTTTAASRSPSCDLKKLANQQKSTPRTIEEARQRLNALRTSAETGDVDDITLAIPTFRQRSLSAAVPDYKTRFRRESSALGSTSGTSTVASAAAAMSDSQATGSLGASDPAAADGVRRRSRTASERSDAQPDQVSPHATPPHLMTPPEHRAATPASSTSGTAIGSGKLSSSTSPTPSSTSRKESRAGVSGLPRRTATPSPVRDLDVGIHL